MHRRYQQDLSFIAKRALVPFFIEVKRFVYCIGGWSTKASEGRTNKVYQLNLFEPNLQWREVASMSESRYYFGAAVYNGCLVFNGSSTRSKTTSAYNEELNRWRNIAATNRRRGYHQVVATNEAF